MGCLLLYEYVICPSLTSYSLGICVGVSDLELRLAWVPISFVFWGLFGWYIVCLSHYFGSLNVSVLTSLSERRQFGSTH